mgnify:CR=1 FL=1
MAENEEKKNLQELLMVKNINAIRYFILSVMEDLTLINLLKIYYG